MLLAKLGDISNQMKSSANLDQALAYLQSADIHRLADGRYAIDGDRVYALVQSYDTLVTEAQFEAHRRYIDIQYIAIGSERMDWLPVEQMTITQDYQTEKDVCKGVDAGGLAVSALVRAGQAAIFFPEDAHAPKLAVGQPEAVRKIVIKVVI
jgi:YhcH/YjgK/YiaL family protein